MGPTRRESSSWSYSELECASQQEGQVVGMVGNSRGGRADIGELPLKILVQLLKTFEGDLELVG